MKNLSYIWIALIAASLLWGCGDDTSPTNPPTQVEEASAQKQFVWNAMNFWYYWQADVPELADNYFADDQAFHEYLNGFSDAEAVFNALLYEPEDDFSFFIEDYEEFQQSQQGISQSFGFQYGLVRFAQSSDNIFGYVQYVLEGEPADEAGLVRGDIFTSVDGTQLTINNYQDLLLGRTSYELSLAQIEGTTISETGETVPLEAVTLTEDPVHIAKVLDGTNIGYLMYNSFQLNSHQRLNDVFDTFDSESVDELVVDLRYNSGGTVITSQLLGSLISGLGSSTDFATYSYNTKLASALDTTEAFLDQAPIFDENREPVSEEPINTLSLNRVYFLVDRGTASASELVINALNPYIDVILIGERTTGKDDGSYTLYDAPAPYLNEENANPDHKIAIQPIALKLVNSEGDDYPDGFSPDGYDPNLNEGRGGCPPQDDSDNCVNELDFVEDLPPLGEESDPLLAKALELITGQARMKVAIAPSSSHRTLLTDSRDLQPYGNQLYVQPPTNAKERMNEGKK